MNAAAVITALALPPETRVDKRVPKKLLVDQGVPTAADKRQIQNGIEELMWIAALKPSNVGVPAYRDDDREYLEIAILTADLRPGAKAVRVTELIHRAIPYPVLLVVVQGDSTGLSLAHKRLARNETKAVVVDRTVITTPPLGAKPPAVQEDLARRFFESLPLALQPRVHLCALYHGWIDRVEALLAARFTGRFSLTETSHAAAERRAALVEYDRIQMEIVGLRARALKETQVNRRVVLNLSIRRLEAELAKTSEYL
jgi:hypothetical protein